jgi:hypothetical protein
MIEQTNEIERKKNLSSIKYIYLLGAFFTVLVLIGVVLDIIVGTVTGGNLTALPQTAVERFIQLHSNCLLGLYNLDFLNVINQLLMIPVYFTLYLVLRDKSKFTSLFAFVIFIVGTILFVSNNTALTMLDLSIKYFSASSDQTKILFASAGEAMLTKGSHGSYSALIGFLLPNIAGIILSVVMLKNSIFSKITGYLGLFGSVLISIYLLMVTVLPSVKSMATAFAAIPGLMLMAWMTLFMLKLFKLTRK